MSTPGLPKASCTCGVGPVAQSPKSEPPLPLLKSAKFIAPLSMEKYAVAVVDVVKLLTPGLAKRKRSNEPTAPVGTVGPERARTEPDPPMPRASSTSCVVSASRSYLLGSCGPVLERFISDRFKLMLLSNAPPLFPNAVSPIALRLGKVRTTSALPLTGLFEALGREARAS